MSVLKYLQETLIIESPRTMTFWHGGNLEDYSDTVAHKKGRSEFGPGLYLTTSWEVVQKYRKGSRKLYRIIVSEGVDARESMIPFSDVESFVNTHVPKAIRQEVLSRIDKRLKDGKIQASLLTTILINNDALKKSTTKTYREFLVNQGVDYEIVNNAFGWGEAMMVLYNMKKIVDVKQMTPKDKIDTFDLDTKFK